MAKCNPGRLHGASPLPHRNPGDFVRGVWNDIFQSKSIFQRPKFPGESLKFRRQSDFRQISDSENWKFRARRIAIPYPPTPALRSFAVFLWSRRWVTCKVVGDVCCLVLPPLVCLGLSGLGLPSSFCYSGFCAPFLWWLALLFLLSVCYLVCVGSLVFLALVSVGFGDPDRRTFSPVRSPLPLPCPCPLLLHLLRPYVVVVIF